MIPLDLFTVQPLERFCIYALNISYRICLGDTILPQMLLCSTGRSTIGQSSVRVSADGAYVTTCDVKNCLFRRDHILGIASTSASTITSPGLLALALRYPLLRLLRTIYLQDL